ncbi:MAG: hypothetical protein RL172_2693 [Bacteroidota bacterium]|jgi:polyisoprenoid-binding protein YceI
MVKAVYLITVVAIALAGAAASVPAALYKVAKGSIYFKSDAPLELIKATSDELAGLFDTDKKNFAFRIKMDSFKGFNGALQKEHFNENYMETSKYPYASFEGKIIEDIDYSTAGNYQIRAKGNLVVHGVSQERIIKVTLQVKKQGITAQAAFTVLLADHNITIPKVVHEKLASEIKVQIDAALTSQ